MQANMYTPTGQLFGAAFSIPFFLKEGDSMGGRGGSSSFKAGGNGGGLDVTRDGQTTRYYFTNHNGTNYYQRGVDGMPEPTPNNMTEKEFKRRVEANGAVTKAVSREERSKDEKRYKADRRATNAFLDRETASNRMLSSGSRADAKVNRVNRRRRG
ncbi:hypothetical protein [Blautia sp. 1033sp1_1033st1_G9_1033SCRN_220408]|uniref:hypothetical protein n=1 Tax=Blautia sp. 1033sp1_1033st1_G9_1033SCRN_220408 TaxID=3144490 RepID=UPI0034A56367